MFYFYSYRRTIMRNNQFQIRFQKAVIIISFYFSIILTTSSNLLINGDFSMTNLAGLNYKYVLGGVDGWNCTNKCQIDDCLRLNQYYQLLSSFNAACTGQVIDLTSDSIQNVSQQVTLSSGDYLLSLTYYYPRVSANYKTLFIYFNEQLIFSFTPNVSCLFQSFYFQKKVKGLSGLNTIRLTNKNNVGNDVFGYSINNVSLIVYSEDWVQQIINATLFNPLVVSLIEVPGYRTIFGDLASLFVNFDRIQFYYYHNRSYSFYSYLLLYKINNINNLKGTAIRKIYEIFNPTAVDDIQNAFYQLDKKQPYTPQYMLLRGLNSEGIVSNMHGFIVYNIPGTLIVFGFLYGTFQLLRARPVSRMVRKYSFCGIFFIMLLDGNVESITYFTMRELRIFFSANPAHKITNILILYFYFTVCFICVGSLLWMRCIYRQRINYLLDNRKQNSLGLACYIIDNGLIAAIFGTLHQLLLNYPNAQLAALILFECIWIIVKIYMIWKKVYRFFGIETILLISGLIRVCLILTIFTYERYEDQRSMINSQIHKTIIIIFVVLWALQLSLSIFQIFYQFSSFCKKRLFKKKSKIQANLHFHQDLGNMLNRNKSISFKLIKADILKIKRTKQGKYFGDFLDNVVIKERIKRMMNHSKE